jgi:DNA polymerase III subunit beta
MEFEIKAGDLASAAAYAAAACAPRTAQPILAGVKIAAADGQVTFTGSDNESSTAIAVEKADGSEPGAIVVPGKLLAEITKSLPAGASAVLGPDETAGSTAVVLKCGRAEFTIVTMDEAIYPDLPEPGKPAGRVAADLLAQAAERVSGMVARDDKVIALTGVQMILGPREITLSATDRYRIVRVTVPWFPAADPGGDLAVALTVPAQYLSAAAKAMPPEAEVGIGFTGHPDDPSAPVSATFSTPGRTLTCRLISEEYPGTAKMFTLTPAATATVNRRDLQAAATRVSSLADRNTALKLEFRGGQVELRAGGQRGRSSEYLVAELDGPDVLELSFMPSFLTDILAGAGTQTVSFSPAVEEDRKAILIADGAPEGSRDDSFRYLLMRFSPAQGEAA